MKIVTISSLLILVASMVFGGMTNNVYAQDDPTILLKIAKRAQEQLHNQISIDSSDKVKKLFEEGMQQVNALEESLRSDDASSIKEYFLSAMKIFTEISRQLAVSDVTYDAKTNSMKNNIKDPSNTLERLQGYVNSIKIIAKKHNTLIDFSEVDDLFNKARQQIAVNQFTLTFETIHQIKESIVKINKELREEASKQESQRAKEFSQKYLEQLDRLIEHAKKQSVDDEIIKKLESAKKNLISANNPGEIVNEIRKIVLIKDKFELTTNDRLESKVLQIEKSLLKLSEVDGVDQNNLKSAKDMLQNIKLHLYEGEFNLAENLTKNLTKQLEEIKNSM